MAGRHLSPELSDTKVYEPCIRARLVGAGKRLTSAPLQALASVTYEASKLTSVFKVDEGPPQVEPGTFAPTFAANASGSNAVFKPNVANVAYLRLVDFCITLL